MPSEFFLPLPPLPSRPPFARRITLSDALREHRARLESLDRANAAQRRLPAGCREGTPLDRTRTAVTAGLRKKLKDLMLDFQALRQRMMSE